MFAAWAGLLAVHTTGPAPGVVFGIGAASYGLIRLWTDGLRELPRRRVGLADSQLVAAALAAVGLIGLLAAP